MKYRSASTLLLASISLPCFSIELDSLCRGYAAPLLTETGLIGNVREVVFTKQAGLFEQRAEIKASFNKALKPVQISTKYINGKPEKEFISTFEYDQSGNLIKSQSIRDPDSKVPQHDGEPPDQEMTIRYLEPGYRVINYITTWYSKDPRSNGRKTKTTSVERTLELPNGGKKRICIGIEDSYGILSNSITDFHPKHLRMIENGMFDLKAQPRTVEDAIKALAKIDRLIPSLDPSYYQQFAYGKYRESNNGYGLYINGKLTTTYDHNGNSLHEKSDAFEFTFDYRWNSDGNWAERKQKFIPNPAVRPNEKSSEFTDHQTVIFW